MKKTRVAAKWFAGTVAVTALVLASLSAPAQAKDTGWGKVSDKGTVVVQHKALDTGWG